MLVEVKKEDRTTRPKRMTIKTFLKGYLKEDWYIVSVLPDEMRGEVKVGILAGQKCPRGETTLVHSLDNRHYSMKMLQ